MLLLTALLLAVAIATGAWAAMTSHEENQHLEKRLAQVQLAAEKDSVKAIDKQSDPKQDSRNFLKEFKTGSTHVKNSLMRPFLFSLPLALIWHAAVPVMPLAAQWPFAFVMFVVGKRFINARRLKLRLEQMEHELPGVLDLLVVCVEAGMSLSKGLYRVAQENEGAALSKELLHTFHELNLGVPLEQAFRLFSKRCPVPDVQAFATSIIQADKLGISLGETLRVQSTMLRETIRMRTREQIFKVPVKMIFPMVLFILPVLFLLILGPAFLQVWYSGVLNQITSISANVPL